MDQVFIIDGNNLLHAVRVLGPQRAPGREKLLRIIEQWATGLDHDVMLVFDGPTPRGGFAEQMKSTRIEVVFSESRTADDCIVERLEQPLQGAKFLVVSDDSAIQYEARRNSSQTISTTAFIALLFPPDSVAAPKDATAHQSKDSKPILKAERDHWLELFDDGKSDQPFDGFDAMQH